VDDNIDKEYRAKKTPVVSEADSSGSLEETTSHTPATKTKKKCPAKKAKVSSNTSKPP
jgi:hypothetical protein